MTAPLSVFNCTEIAKSIVWPHGDYLVVFSHSLNRLPTKQILQKEKCEIPLGCSGSGKGGDASLRAQLLLKCCMRDDAAAGLLVLARLSFPQLNSFISCHAVLISPLGLIKHQPILSLPSTTLCLMSAPQTQTPLFFCVNSAENISQVSSQVLVQHQTCDVGSE